MKKFNFNGLVCGCDEAGRGCLAGPVVAAAVILPNKFSNKDINDSKKISKKKRTILSNVIKNESIAWAIGIVAAGQIDQINILNASIKAMHHSINLITKKIKKQPDILLIDGNRFKTYLNIPHQCIIKGDQKYISIASASILAKTYRDNLMIDLGKNNPQYNWPSNKGYPTQEHKSAIMQYGITKYHRKSFKLFKNK